MVVAWLHHVVVGSSLVALYLVAYVVKRRKHDDRHVVERLVLANVADDGIAVHVGQHDVAYYERGLAGNNSSVSVCTIGIGDGLEIYSQFVGELFEHVSVVLYDGNSFVVEWLSHWFPNHRVVCAVSPLVGICM